MTPHFTERTRRQLLEEYRATHPMAVSLAHDPSLSHQQEAHHLEYLVRGFERAPMEERLRWCHRISTFIEGVAVEQMGRDELKLAAEDPRGAADNGWSGAA